MFYATAPRLPADSSARVGGAADVDGAAVRAAAAGDVDLAAGDPRAVEAQVGVAAQLVRR